MNKDIRREPLTELEVEIIRAKYAQPKVKIKDLAKAHKRPAYLISLIVSCKSKAHQINAMPKIQL
jgi:hypothetical protein